MKINFDKNLLKYCIYVVATVTALYILYGVIGNIGVILKTIFGFLGNLFNVLSPLIIALVVVYLLHPMVSWIEVKLLGKVKMEHKAKRTLSVILTYLLIISILVLFIYGIYAMIGGQITNNVNIRSMIDSIATYTQRYEDIFQSSSNLLDSSGLSEDLKGQIKNLMDGIRGFVGAAINSAFNSVKNFGSNIVDLVLSIFISFYILKDLDYFKKLTNDFFDIVFKNNTNKKARLFIRDVDYIVSKFLRGQFMDAIIVGLLSSLGLWIIGLDFPVLIGMTAGFGNIIPYFGPILGGIPAVIVGLLSGTPIKALFAVLVLTLVQQLDSAVISPKVVGESVGLHPVFVILSILIGGAYFGLLGMLIAVPAAAILKMLFMRWRESTIES